MIKEMYLLKEKKKRISFYLWENFRQAIFSLSKWVHLKDELFMFIIRYFKSSHFTHSLVLFSTVLISSVQT